MLDIVQIHRRPAGDIMVIELRQRVDGHGYTQVQTRVEPAALGRFVAALLDELVGNAATASADPSIESEFSQTHIESWRDWAAARKPELGGDHG